MLVLSRATHTGGEANVEDVHIKYSGWSGSNLPVCYIEQGLPANTSSVFPNQKRQATLKCKCETTELIDIVRSFMQIYGEPK